jgi:hypothetical protein
MEQIKGDIGYHREGSRDVRKSAPARKMRLRFCSASAGEYVGTDLERFGGDMPVSCKYLVYLVEAARMQALGMERYRHDNEPSGRKQLFLRGFFL